MYHLTPADVAELDCAVAAALAKGIRREVRTAAIDLAPYTEAPQLYFNVIPVSHSTAPLLQGNYLHIREALSSKADFVLPTLGPKFEAIRENVRIGRGFQLIKYVLMASIHLTQRLLVPALCMLSALTGVPLDCTTACSTTRLWLCGD